MGDPLPPSNPCRDGWLHRWATVWECLEPGMGTTCEGCSVLTPGRVPEDDPCRDPGIAHPQGRTCYCPTVLGQTPGREAEGVGNQVAAVNEAQWGCGAKLEVRRLPSGPTKRVLRVDAGPYGPDGNPRRNYIDLHRAVFGVPPGGRWEVCVRAVKTTPGQAGPDIDGRLSPARRATGGDRCEHEAYHRAPSLSLFAWRSCRHRDAAQPTRRALQAVRRPRQSRPGASSRRGRRCRSFARTGVRCSR